MERSPTDLVETKSRGFGGKLEPRTLSAQNHLTSEQLRTL